LSAYRERGANGAWRAPNIRCKTEASWESAKLARTETRMARIVFIARILAAAGGVGAIGSLVWTRRI
jgi:hypothetical protein